MQTSVDNTIWKPNLKTVFTKEYLFLSLIPKTMPRAWVEK
jgi:hypothetical protein